MAEERCRETGGNRGNWGSGNFGSAWCIALDASSGAKMRARDKCGEKFGLRRSDMGIVVALGRLSSLKPPPRVDACASALFLSDRKEDGPRVTGIYCPQQPSKTKSRSKTTANVKVEPRFKPNVGSAQALRSTLPANVQGGGDMNHLVVGNSNPTA